MIRFVPSWYPSGRILLRAGECDVGAVYPPLTDPRATKPSARWVWRLWINGRTVPSEGREKTEDEAKAALLAAWLAFLSHAGAQPAQREGGADAEGS